MTTLQRTIVGHCRAVLTIALATITLAVFTTACSGSGAAAQEDPNAPVLLGVSEPYITVQNRAGLALSDVTVAVVSYNGLEFTKTFSRIENSQRREISFTELSSRDGTQFNPRFYKAKAVRLRASDVVGKQYEVETPWR
jgi:hypothetical protein